MKNKKDFWGTNEFMHKAIKQVDEVRKHFVSIGAEDLLLDLSHELIKLADNAKANYEDLTAHNRLALREKVKKLYQEMKEQGDPQIHFVSELLINDEVIIPREREYSKLGFKLIDLGCYNWNEIYLLRGTPEG
ncbi:MAG: hypothetical protein IJQ47_00840 [Synergistaceae bacterium]|nr:hypothetical protein [Synergistaceae bacterium]